jgi:pimeloyl-ACP methyl ester carboxylesterase
VIGRGLDAGAEATNPGFGRRTHRRERAKSAACQCACSARRAADLRGEARRVGRVAAIAEALGIEQFGVFGVSGGACHALAVAAALPRRVTRCATVVGKAPLGVADLAFYEGMATDEQESWRQIEARDLRSLRVEWAQTVGWVEAGLPGLSVSQSVIEMLQQALGEAARAGPEGFLEDCLAFSEGWGFEVEEVAVPTRMMFARGDTTVPVQHVAWFERHLPGVQISWVDGDHFGPRDEPEMALVDWVAGP